MQFRQPNGEYQQVKPREVAKPEKFYLSTQRKVIWLSGLDRLAKRLEKGPLLMEQVLKYGAQVADGWTRRTAQGLCTGT